MSSEPRAQPGAFARAILLALFAVSLTPLPAFAVHHHRFARFASFSPTDPQKDAALVVDGATGRPLYARNADAMRHPASLTKMMTLYLLFDALKEGRVSMATSMRVSPHAAAQKPTNLHLRPGDEISVETAIKAIVVRSANDVAVTIAEFLGGTESHFAELMTARARDLGMRSTYYHNASGLPDPLQITTASDLAILARHLGYDYPQYFHYFSTPSFYFRGVDYPTHDNLIGRYEGADGIKTGYTGMSGFNLVSSVVRGGAHIIGVVLGGRTAHARDRAMVALLDSAFGQVARNPMLVARAQVPWHATTLALNSSPIEINAAGPSSAPPGTQSGPVGAAPGESGPALAMNAPAMPGSTDDEDAAENKTNEGNLDLSQKTVIMPVVRAAQAPPSKPAPAVSAPPALVRVAVSITPRPKPRQIAEMATAAQQTVIVSLTPRLKPVLNLALRGGEVGEGDISYEHPTAAESPPRDWIIQIGAFPTQTLAQDQLATYAQKATDVLGKTARLVAPFQAVDGHTVYRARFGPLAERDARNACMRLNQKGQTCFAEAASR